MSSFDIAPHAARNNQRTASAAISAVTGVYAAYDRVQAWFKQPLTGDEFKKIKLAGVAKVVTYRGHARFDERYVRRAVFTVPSLDALAVLRDLRAPEDVLVNIVEPGLSINFDDEAAKLRLFWFIAETWIKNYSNDQEVRFVGEGNAMTRYSGRAHARNVSAIYPDRPCRITGELESLHPDWRLNGAAVCRAVGIDGFQDLIDFDHVGFWRKRLRLAVVDHRKLGRMFLNRESGQRRRKPRIDGIRFPYDVDLRTGVTLAKAAGRTTQDAIDRYRAKLAIRKCLISIDVEPLLAMLSLD